MTAARPDAPFDVVVSGSTSNLGPGFDALGLALDLHLRVRVADLDDDGRGATEWQFEGPPLEGENLIDSALRWDPTGARGQPALPSMRIEVMSAIPLRAGLGSSAAAIVAGRRLNGLLRGHVERRALLDECCALEGHPDNTSASVLGGLVTASRGDDGHVTAVSTPWPHDIRLVVATPRLGLSTKAARAVLPTVVPFADAVFNVQRVALLVSALHAGDCDAVRHALGDRLHQPARARLVPGLSRALAFDDPSVLGVFLSGAGPSIAALVADDGRAAMTFFTSLYGELSISCDVRCLSASPPITW